MEEILAEIVKNAVHEALSDMRAQLDGIEEKVTRVEKTVTGMSEDPGAARAADIEEVRSAVNYLTGQLEMQDRSDSLEVIRLQTKLSIAERRAS